MGEQHANGWRVSRHRLVADATVGVRRGLPSPDRADAVAMALVQHEAVVDLAAHRKGRMISDGILQMDW